MYFKLGKLWFNGFSPPKAGKNRWDTSPGREKAIKSELPLKSIGKYLYLFYHTFLYNAIPYDENLHFFQLKW